MEINREGKRDVSKQVSKVFQSRLVEQGLVFTVMGIDECATDKLQPDKEV